MKYLLALIILFASPAYAAEQPEAERAMMLLQTLQIPASQAEVVVEVKREIVTLQRLIEAQKKAIKECRTEKANSVKTKE